MERVAVDFWRWPRRERSTDIRSDLGQASNAGQRQKRRNPTGARQKSRLAASLLRCSPLRGCASLAPCHPPLLPLRAAHSSISTVLYEFPRLFFHCCFSVKLRRGSAHLEASDGSDDKHRFSERPVCLEGYQWRYSDDDLVLPHARIAAAIRPELSLSIPRFERDLHHTDGSGSPEGKVKHATGGWGVADQRRDRARFTQLATVFYGGRSSATPQSEHQARSSSPLHALGPALRRFRPKVSASVLLDEDRPAYVRGADVCCKIIDQRGPFLISGNWWDEKSWTRAEWDLQLETRELVLGHESQGTWAIDGIYD